MKYSSNFIMKNGKPCQLKSLNSEEVQELYEIFNLTHEQTDFLLSYPDENSYNVEQEAQFLAKKENSPNEIEIGAFVDGRIVGSAGIEAIGAKGKIKHRADLGIAIAKDYWGLGIGRGLMSACIDCAKQAGYRQIELDVVADNISATTLYKSLGFVEFGRNPRGFNSRNTGWQELVSMRLELD